MVLCLNLGDILGRATPCAQNLVVYLADIIGAFSSSPMATMSILSPYISSMPIQMETHQMILPVVYNSGSSYGTQKRQMSTNTILLTTGSRRKKATGASHDLWSYGNYTHLLGMIQGAIY